MRVAAIVGLGSSVSLLQPFADVSDAVWQTGLPANPDQADAILVLGGDGTVHRHLPQLVKLQLPVLVVPHGSGNDFARALKLRRVDDAVDAWRRFASGQDNVRQIDLGVISQVLGPMRRNYPGAISAVSAVSDSTSRSRAVPTSSRARCAGMAVTCSAFCRHCLGFTRWGKGPGALARVGGWETRHEGPAMVAAFANTPTYGGGIRIAPDARLDDGMLETCVVGAMARARLLRLFPWSFLAAFGHSPRSNISRQNACESRRKNRQRFTPMASMSVIRRWR